MAELSCAAAAEPWLPASPAPTCRYQARALAPLGLIVSFSLAALLGVGLLADVGQYAPMVAMASVPQINLGTMANVLGARPMPRWASPAFATSAAQAPAAHNAAFLGRQMPQQPVRSQRFVHASAATKEYQMPQNLYQLLDVSHDASLGEIKKAYRKLAKSCHPDIAGSEATDLCVMLNNAFQTLSDPMLRSVYDSEMQAYSLIEDGYNGQPLSRWNEDPSGKQRGVFVDESSCIGCRMCINLAEATFGQEDEWGRARVHTQWGNLEDDVLAAIESCPVDCIHFVDKDSLAALEWCMTSAKRVNVAAMLSGGGARAQDPFTLAQEFLTKRDEKRNQIQGQERRDRQRVQAGAMKNNIQLAFAEQIGDAWNKLKTKTKAAWTFNREDEENFLKTGLANS
eukprot:gnl/TRDRNA2_/TRDRNA2_46169_c0_seq1.p1 gnl/TRDRNA2_/TRDRNA2_46169_c0~~gnl/TRDRNA2_/TRDRNA2_46169_c0_seq1.p1  ORF type:complete len:398 (+),score=72.11 gnl/TRDRNA2_/TRDRNA2_46169_c0_seq1:68-1261(+)